MRQVIVVSLAAVAVTGAAVGTMSLGGKSAFRPAATAVADGGSACGTKSTVTADIGPGAAGARGEGGCAHEPTVAAGAGCGPKAVVASAGCGVKALAAAAKCGAKAALAMGSACAFEGAATAGSPASAEAAAGRDHAATKDGGAGPDAAMSNICQRACAARIPYEEKDVVAQPGAAEGDLARCPVSGVVFQVAAANPELLYRGASYRFCCEVCAEKFRSRPSRFVAS